MATAAATVAAPTTNSNHVRRESIWIEISRKNGHCQKAEFRPRTEWGWANHIEAIMGRNAKDKKAFRLFFLRI
jgi:hypothetical protein